MMVHKCRQRQDKHDGHDNKNAHPDISRYSLCARTYGNTPADKERPHSVAEVEYGCNHTDHVEHEVDGIDYNTVHVDADLTLVNRSDSNLKASLEKCHATKINVITPVTRCRKNIWLRKYP